MFFLIGPVGTALAAWETAWYLRRRYERAANFQVAQDRATELGRPLVVIGDPQGGITWDDYGCGDIAIDLTGCPSCGDRGHRADICEPGAIPLKNDSAVVYVSCVLEYVTDFQAAVREILRVAGSIDNVFVTRVEPWTLASVAYPNAQRTVSVEAGGIVEAPIRSPLPWLGRL